MEEDYKRRAQAFVGTSLASNAVDKMCMKKPETSRHLHMFYYCIRTVCAEIHYQAVVEINIFNSCWMYTVGDIFFIRGASQARFQPFLYRPRPVSLIFVIRCQMRHVPSSHVSDTVHPAGQLVLRTPPAVVAPPPTCIRPGPSRYMHWWDRLELARSGGTGTPIALLGRSLREGSAQVPVPLRIPFSEYSVPVGTKFKFPPS